MDARTRSAERTYEEIPPITYDRPRSAEDSTYDGLTVSASPTNSEPIHATLVHARPYDQVQSLPQSPRLIAVRAGLADDDREEATLQRLINVASLIEKAQDGNINVTI
jgi:hypothetical protein